MKSILVVIAILVSAGLEGCSAPKSAARPPPPSLDSLDGFVDPCGYLGDSLRVKEDGIYLYTGRLREKRGLTGRSGDTVFFETIAFLHGLGEDKGHARYYFAFNVLGDREKWRDAVFMEALPRNRVVAGKAYVQRKLRNRQVCIESGDAIPEPPADPSLYDYEDMSVSDLFRIEGIDSAVLDLEIDPRYFTGFTRYDPEAENGETPVEPMRMVKVREIYGGRAENFGSVPVSRDHLRRLGLTHSQLLKAGARLKAIP